MCGSAGIERDEHDTTTWLRWERIAHFKIRDLAGREWIVLKSSPEVGELKDDSEPEENEPHWEPVDIDRAEWFIRWGGLVLDRYFSDEEADKIRKWFKSVEGPPHEWVTSDRGDSEDERGRQPRPRNTGGRPDATDDTPRTLWYEPQQWSRDRLKRIIHTELVQLGVIPGPDGNFHPPTHQSGG